MNYQEYIENLKFFNIEPNFYCSDEYLEKSKLKIKLIKNVVYIEDLDWFVFPPFNINNGEFIPMKKKEKIWADFPDSRIEKGTPEFFDFDYLYNPNDFNDLSGKKWKVFRKNIRKFPNRYSAGNLFYVPLDFYLNKFGNKIYEIKVLELLENWLESKNENIEDDENLLHYIFDGKNRWLLISDDEEILAINIYDFNYKYTNYRYCVCKNLPFLSEYARFLFYTKIFEIRKNFIVCDGGILGKKSLKDFKDKLNPFKVRVLNSWKYKGD